jgi:hypothetical protein
MATVTQFRLTRMLLRLKDVLSRATAGRATNHTSSTRTTALLVPGNLPGMGLHMGDGDAGGAP